MKLFFLSRLWPVCFLFLSQVSLAQRSEHFGTDPDQAGRIKQLKVKSLSDLQQLTPYESVSVIQKRYLPKTFRGELNVSFSSVINHTFFYLGGLSARLGFFLREDHGFGLEGFALLPPFDKQVTNEITSPPNRILPYTAVFSQLYGGIYYKWSPVFGKFAVLNTKIIYFDMYMTFGLGMSRVIEGLDEEKRRKLEEDQDFPELVRPIFPTFNVSLGQIFALSQDWAFNWELKWLYTIIQYKNQRTYTPTDINFSLGFNYYFPGAGYR